MREEKRPRYRVRVSGAALFKPGDNGCGSGEPSTLDAVRKRDGRLRHSDRITLLSLAGARAALGAAGLGPDDPRRRGAGVYLGNAFGAFETDLQHQRSIGEGGGPVSPAIFSYTLPNVPGGWISIVEKIEGPLFTFAGGTLAAAESLAAARFSLACGFEAGPTLAGSSRARVPEVIEAIRKVRGGGALEALEGSAFVVLEAARDLAEGDVEFAACGLSRSAGCPDPLEEVLKIAAQGSKPHCIAAGDASRDRETAIRLEAAGFDHAILASELAGDLGEASPAAGAYLAWDRFRAKPGADEILVAGLDACGRRAFAMLFRLFRA